MTSRRKFLLSMAAAIGAPAPAVAQSDAATASVVRQLEAQGFVITSIQRTLLGRVRVVARRGDLEREIVFDPRNGAILRDFTVDQGGAPSIGPSPEENGAPAGGQGPEGGGTPAGDDDDDRGSDDDDDDDEGDADDGGDDDDDDDDADDDDDDDDDADDDDDDGDDDDDVGDDDDE